jgi:hypothetical protein
MLRTLEQMGEWERKGRWGGENQAYREMPSCSVKAEVKIVAVKMEATVVWKLLPPSYRSRCAETAAAPGPGMAEEQRGRRRGGVVRRTARRRGGADCEAAWSRSTSCGRRMTRSRGAEGRGGGGRRPDPRGGVRSPGGKAADRVYRTRGSGLPNSDKFGHGPKLPRGSVPWKTRGFGVPK